MTKCGAKTRNGTQCNRPSGWGTKHVGIGKCKLHGGASPIKHGLYSKYTKHTLADTVQTLVDDPELTNLRQQIAFKQAMILGRLDHVGEGMAEADMRFLADLSEKVARDIERLNKIEHGEKFVLKVEEVQAIVQQITFIIQQELDDESVTDRIASRLQQLKW
jgi:hypothetical protein